MLTGTKPTTRVRFPSASYKLHMLPFPSRVLPRLSPRNTEGGTKLVPPLLLNCSICLRLLNCWVGKLSNTSHSSPDPESMSLRPANKIKAYTSPVSTAVFSSSHACSLSLQRSTVAYRKTYMLYQTTTAGKKYIQRFNRMPRGA